MDMSSKYKFKIEYELRRDDENLDDDDKIRLITYGNTAKEVVDNHDELMYEWAAFLVEAGDSFKEQVYKRCEELEAEAMKNKLK